MILNYTIRFPPVTKKNSQQILRDRKTGRPFIFPSKQYKDYERAAIPFLMPLPKEPIDYPVNVKMLFYMPTRRRVDLSNLENCILDILVNSGVLLDDNRNVVAATDGSRVYYDRNFPRTEIEIKELDDYEVWKK